jgi:hypothetical protein
MDAVDRLPGVAFSFHFVVTVHGSFNDELTALVVQRRNDESFEVRIGVFCTGRKTSPLPHRQRIILQAY